VGPFGGKVMCATMTQGTQQLPACGWVDDGTFGFVLASASDEAGVLSLMAEVRAVAEK
jgi:hypothetical protein